MHQQQDQQPQHHPIYRKARQPAGQIGGAPITPYNMHVVQVNPARLLDSQGIDKFLDHVEEKVRYRTDVVGVVFHINAKDWTTSLGARSFASLVREAAMVPGVLPMQVVGYTATTVTLCVAVQSLAGELAKRMLRAAVEEMVTLLTEVGHMTDKTRLTPLAAEDEPYSFNRVRDAVAAVAHRAVMGVRMGLFARRDRAKDANISGVRLASVGEMWGE